MLMPTEDEIRAKASDLGIAAVNGKYPQRDRARIVAAIQADQHAADEAAAEAADPLSGTTAEILARFDAELLGQDILGGARARILAAAAAHLLETRDLRLVSPRKETTPS